jgi:murein DD-endopeptidase MepM/ murein hydrolase activator NlpD
VAAPDFSPGVVCSLKRVAGFLRTRTGRRVVLAAASALILVPARWIAVRSPQKGASAAPTTASLVPSVALPPIPLLRSRLHKPAPGSAADATEGGSTDALPVTRYTVVQGDTLGAIAARFHTDVASIAASNGISPNHTLQIGEVLQVPTRVGWVYPVISGDTLSGIGSRYGVSADRLAQVNHLDVNSVLQIGQRLWIPSDPPASGAPAAGPRHAVEVGPAGSSGGSGASTAPQGGLLWPVRGVITSPFGWRYLFGRRDFHDGIDIGVPWGTPVHAAVSGTVVGAGWDGPYGIAVRIQTGDMLTMYAHNSRLAVHVGERVAAGQLISYAGATGNATGPHVHFGVYIDGVAVNPMNYLR